MCLIKPKISSQCCKLISEHLWPLARGQLLNRLHISPTLLAAMFKSMLLVRFGSTGKLNPDCLVWLIREFSTRLLEFLSLREAVKLATLSFRMNQWVNLRGAARFNRRVPWVSRLKHFRCAYRNEIFGANVKRRRRR